MKPQKHSKRRYRFLSVEKISRRVAKGIEPFFGKRGLKN
jgi:hypothetical protein